MIDPLAELMQNALKSLGGAFGRSNDLPAGVFGHKAEMLPVRQAETDEVPAWNSVFGLTYTAEGNYIIFTAGTTPANSRAVSIAGAWVSLKCDGNFSQDGTLYQGSSSGYIFVEVDRLNAVATLKLASSIPDNTENLEHAPLWYIPARVDGKIPQEYTVDLRYTIRVTGMA